MNLLKLTTIILMVWVSNVGTQAKEWRGIVPLHSTRADVEGLLGPPLHHFAEARSLYVVDHADVEIVFADRSLHDSEHCSGKVPLGTVLSIFVLPQGDMSLSDLQIDLKHTKVLNVPFGQLEYRAYYDERSGFIVRTLNGKVHDICYLGSADVRHLCSHYYRNAKHFGEMRSDNF